MIKRMLIDATHPEETRVVVINDNRLEEFDFETSSKKQLKGNIYLAKVTRVEPSLQAAFVEYGGNRHGFLAFTEIHPDYYRIPVADREALIAAEIEAERAHAVRELADTERAGGDDQDTAEDEDEDADEDDEDGDAEEDEDGGEGEERGEAADGIAAAGAAGDSPAEAQGEGSAAAGAIEASDPATGAEYIAAAAETRAEYIAEAVEDDHAEHGGTKHDAETHGDDPVAAAFASETFADEHPRSHDPVNDHPGDHRYSAERFGDYDDASLGGEARGDAEEAEEDDGAEHGGADHDAEAHGSAPIAEPHAPDHAAEAEAGDTRDGAAALAPEPIETVGGDDVEEAHERHAFRPRRNYKIQEVIKRRQIMLVQVTKEERGNKGAALTTYLSLAGRYCVLMPNTPRGGGISRKITNIKERKRMKAILDGLQIPEGMAVILRTAGLKRTRAEMKRDLDYLLRLWDSIREQTLKSTAPTLIHEEANLIKRAIRDLYSKDIDEILVAGDEGYRAAKDFMRMLMPSHAKKVKPYKDDPVPLFHRFQVESQIDAMHSPIVQLRSGGYIVINPTEALVAIDVNSGRATRERNIEETAYKTNLEASDEIARQLRLRDLAGLIVIDFIDMEDDRHNAAVERRLKDAMKIDRARIQLGRISPFGLLELSRQRLRPSLVETHFETCRTCGGTGLIRSLGSAALHLLRAIEEEGLRRRSSEITVHVPTNVALYVLNQKRDALLDIETRSGFRVLMEQDDTLIPPDYRLERTRARSPDEIAGPVVDTARLMAETDAALAAEAEEPEDAFEEQDEEQEEERERPSARTGEIEERGGRGRRKRSRRGRRRGDEPRDTTLGFRPAAAPAPGATETDGEAGDEDDDEAADHPVEAGATEDDNRPRKKRRRGKRGGRRRATLRRHEGEGESAADGQDRASDDGMPPAMAESEDRAEERDELPTGEEAPEEVDTADAAEGPAASPREGAARPRRRSRRRRPGEAIEPHAGATPSADTAGTVNEAGPADAEVVEAEVVGATAIATEPAEAAVTAPNATAAEPARDVSATEAAGHEAMEAVSEPAEPEAIAAEPEANATQPMSEPVSRPVPEEQPHDAPGNGRAEPAAPEPKAEPVAENTAVAANQVVNPPPERPRRGWWQRPLGNG